METIDSILKKIQEKGFKLNGIRTASDYITSATDVPSQLAGLIGGDDKQIRDAILKGSKSLVYSGNGQNVTAYSWTGDKKKVHGVAVGKDLDQPTQVGGSGSIMNFEAITTSVNPDRDGDELMPAGCRIDPNLPLLWQHMSFQPIGKMTALVERNDTYIKQAFGIADLPLGRDACVLIEFGGLRISQGFNPTKFEAIRQGEWDIIGFKIYEWDMLEVSLVSIPANTDAIITAFSRNKLHTPIVKSWAKSFHDSRPVLVAGATPNTGDQVVVNVTVNGQGVVDTPAPVATPAAPPAATPAKTGKSTETPKKTTKSAPVPAGKSGKPKPKKDSVDDVEDDDGDAPEETNTDPDQDDDDDVPTTPVLGELQASLAELCGNTDLDPVLRARINTVNTIIGTASAEIGEAVEKTVAAAQAGDIVGMCQSAKSVSMAYCSMCQLAIDEIASFADGSEEGEMPDDLMDIKDQLTTLNAALSEGGDEGDPNDPSNEDSDGDEEGDSVDVDPDYNPNIDQDIMTNSDDPDEDDPRDPSDDDDEEDEDQNGKSYTAILNQSDLSEAERLAIAALLG